MLYSSPLQPTWQAFNQKHRMATKPQSLLSFRDSACKMIGVQQQDLQMRHIIQVWNGTDELVVAQEQPWLGKLLDCRLSGIALESACPTALQHNAQWHQSENHDNTLCFHNPTTKAGQNGKGQQTVSNSSSMTSIEGVVHENDFCEVAALAIPAYKRPLENSLPTYYCPNAPFEVSPASLPRNNREAQRSFFRGTKDSVTKGSDFWAANSFCSGWRRIPTPQIPPQPHNEQRLLTSH